MHQQTRVKELQAQGLGPSAIATALGLDRKTVRKYLAREDFSPTPPGPVGPARPSQLDPYTATIQGWLAEDRHRSYQQRHTAQRIWERLRAEYPTFQGSYSMVQRYVKGLRATAPTRGTLELVWHPGECPVDFGTADVVMDGRTQSSKYLTVSFPYSNAGYVQLFGGETAECLVTGLQAVFTHWGTVPQRCIFDHASGVGRKVADTVRLTDLFQRFQAHYRFTVTLCNPYSGHEKGHGENKVGYWRRHSLVPPPVVVDWAATNATRLDRCAADGARPPYKKGVCIATLAETDRAAGQPLPPAAFDPVRYVTVPTDGYGKFRGDGAHFYSTAPEYARQSVVVRFGAYTVTALAADGTVLATQPRRFGRQRTDEGDPRTRLTRLARNPGAWGNSAVREADPAAMQTARDGYARDERRAVLQTWATLQGTYGAAVALQALTEAVQRGRSGVADATVLAQRLATWGPDRRPDPGPDLAVYDQALLAGRELW